MSLSSTILQSPEATAFMTSFLCSNCLLDNSQISRKSWTLLERRRSVHNWRWLLTRMVFPYPKVIHLNVIWGNGMGQPYSHIILLYWRHSSLMCNIPMAELPKLTGKKDVNSSIFLSLRYFVIRSI